MSHLTEHIELRYLGLLFTVTLCLATPAVSNAAGFAIQEHSAKQLGMAFAGSGAVADDLSAAWFNPAAMTQLNYGDPGLPTSNITDVRFQRS